jgi:hypothetical protein
VGRAPIIKSHNLAMTFESTLPPDGSAVHSQARERLRRPACRMHSPPRRRSFGECLKGVSSSAVWPPFLMWSPVLSKVALSAAGFEPAQPQLWQLECHPLDHSGIPTAGWELDRCDHRRLHGVSCVADAGYNAPLLASRRRAPTRRADSPATAVHLYDWRPSG